MGFWTALINNIKCAFCRKKKCRLRYQPKREKHYRYDGVNYREVCPKVRAKEEKKRWKRIMK